MRDALNGNMRLSLRLGDDKGALDGGLRVKGKTLSRPIRLDAACLHRLFEVGDQRSGIADDAGSTSIANGWIGVLGLLNHGADQAGEGRQVALNDRLSKVDIC